MRALGIPDLIVNMERDAWILVAAQLPEQMPALMTLKRAQLDDPAVIAMYHDFWSAAAWATDDPRLDAFADRLVAIFEAAPDQDHNSDDFDLDDDLVNLLDSVFLNALPIARQLLRLLEQRGWTGWTRLQRTKHHAGATDTRR